MRWKLSAAVAGLLIGCAPMAGLGQMVRSNSIRIIDGVDDTLVIQVAEALRDSLPFIEADTVEWYGWGVWQVKSPTVRRRVETLRIVDRPDITIHVDSVFQFVAVETTFVEETVTEVLVPLPPYRYEWSPYLYPDSLCIPMKPYPRFDTLIIFRDAPLRVPAQEHSDE